MKISGFDVSRDSRVLIIAEAGINHDGKLEQALKLIDVAAEAGADIVKFQLFKAKTMYTEKAGNYTTASGSVVKINDILKDVELPESWLPTLTAYCREKKLGFLCTVCDENAVDVLQAQHVDAFKMASYALTHHPLLTKVAQTGKTVVISSAAATLGDIDESVRLIERCGNRNIVIMHCVGKYPTPTEKCNLNVLKTLQLAYPEAVIGYSDHTEDPVAAPVCAVALGAKLIEKHFTIDKTLPGADHSFAVDPQGLKQMCDAIRQTERKLAAGEPVAYDTRLCGTSRKDILDIEAHLRGYAYRTVMATKDIQPGDRFTPENIAVLRPGNQSRGLEPDMYPLLLSGFRATQPVGRGDAVTWQSILTK